MGGIISCLFFHSLYDFWYCKKYLIEFGEHLYTNNYYANPITIVVIILLFGGIYYININSKIKKILCYISSISFEMYLGLICADKWAGILREKTEILLITNGFSYFWSFIVWEIGELMFSFLLAVLVNIVVKKILLFLTSIRKRIAG